MDAIDARNFFKTGNLNISAVYYVIDIVCRNNSQFASWRNNFTNKRYFLFHHLANYQYIYFFSGLLERRTGPGRVASRNLTNGELDCEQSYFSSYHARKVTVKLCGFAAR